MVSHPQDLQIKLDSVLNNTLILTRKLGHKVDMPGEAQWQVTSDYFKHLDHNSGTSQYPVDFHALRSG